MNVFKATMLAILLSGSPASSHDFWSNGEKVPLWVKKSCCGENDVHHINPKAVHIMADGIHIDGIETVVPMDKVLPSMDGDYWGFWIDSPAIPKPTIYCFFSPLNGS